MKSQRSNFDLICGMILGGLVVGVLSPMASKYITADTSPKKSMRARAPITHDIKSVSIGKDKAAANDQTKTIASADAQPAKIGEMIEDEAKVETVPTETDKPAAMKADKSTKSKVERAAIKKAEKVKKKAAKLQNKKSTSAVTEDAAETTTASVAAEKTDVALTAVLGTEGSGSEGAMTIANAEYAKDQLSNCSKRCLIRSKDPQGKMINAVISGPAFAEILRDHQGTINITGVKRMVKNYELFMVQNITFNLPSKKQTATATQVQPKAQPQTPMPQKPSDADYEDLADDLKVR